MGFSCGLLGLPNVGKSTIFNALTAGNAKVESYPFSTTEAKKGIVEVPDDRLNELAKLFPDKKKINTRIEFVDIAGLVEGAHKGEGLGNKFLADIREVDSLVHVVRCFENKDVGVVEEQQDPVQNLEIVEAELLLKDLETITNVLRRDKQSHKTELLNKLKDNLERGISVREIDLTDERMKSLSDFSLLTIKPLLYVINVDNSDIGECRNRVKDFARSRDVPVLEINGQIQAEVMEVAQTDEERREYLNQWGLNRTALDQLIKAGYRLLDLITFYTTDGPEVKAWTVPRRSEAKVAANKIHSDFARRFIHAEVIKVDDLLHCGSVQQAKDEGLIRRKGEDYQIEDGDVVHFVSA